MRRRRRQRWLPRRKRREKLEKDYNEVQTDRNNLEKDDDRPIDWNQLCRIIHYIAGYTIHMNEGGTTIQKSIIGSMPLHLRTVKDPT